MTTRTFAVSSTRTRWWIPILLIALSAVPIVAGGARITELASGAEITADNARFFGTPMPIVLHIVAATAYCVLGAFQFLSGLRRSGWHRRAGRVLVPLGLAAAGSGLWMTLGYPQPPGTDHLTTGVRLIFGSLMFIAIVLAVVAIRRRDIPTHRAWMIRGYAIGLGAGTQVFTAMLWILLIGEADELEAALVLGSGWVINLAVAELIIRRSRPATMKNAR